MAVGGPPARELTSVAVHTERSRTLCKFPRNAVVTSSSSCGGVLTRLSHNDKVSAGQKARDCNDNSAHRTVDALRGSRSGVGTCLATQTRRSARGTSRVLSRSASCAVFCLCGGCDRASSTALARCHSSVGPVLARRTVVASFCPGCGGESPSLTLNAGLGPHE